MKKEKGKGKRTRGKNKKMSFQQNISKAIEIVEKRNVLDQKVIMIRFKYVDFELIIDDEEKTQQLIKILTGNYLKKQKENEEVKLPKFYSDKRETK